MSSTGERYTQAGGTSAPASLVTLDSCTFDELYATFSAAFADYEVQVDEPGLRRMLRRRGFDPALSFGLRMDGRLVSFTFNGIGDFAGERCAYDSGTGTLPDFRGQGLASGLFTASLPTLWRAGVRNYVLEVLQHNEAAVSVYKRLGFTTSREFSYHVQSDLGAIRPAPLRNEQVSIRTISFEELNGSGLVPDYEPSWQNSLDSIRRSADTFVLLGAFQSDRALGYALFESATGDVAQLLVNPEARRRGVGSALLRAMLEANRAGLLKMINVDARDSATLAFLSACGIPRKGMQFEMMLPLDASMDAVAGDLP